MSGMNEQAILDVIERIRSRFYGKYRGSVTEVDADTLRIKAKVPAVLGEQTTGWCIACVPYAGDGVGFYSLPRVALAPLFILWFGIGSISKIMMAFSMVVFIVILNTHEGLRGVDRDLVDMLKTMRASRLYMLRKVLLPSIVPWIFASLRVGIGLALVGAVIGELLGANRGLGWYVEYAAGRVDIIGVFAGLVVLAVLGMALNEIVKAVESRVTAGRY